MINDDVKHVNYLNYTIDTKEYLIDHLQTNLLEAHRHIKSLFESNCSLRQQIAELQSKRKVK